MIKLSVIMTLPADRQVRKKSITLETAVMEVGLNLMVYKMKDHVLKKDFCSNKEFISWIKQRNGVMWTWKRKSAPKMCWERYFQQRLLVCLTCKADWSSVHVKKILMVLGRGINDFCGFCETSSAVLQTRVHPVCTPLQFQRTVWHVIRDEHITCLNWSTVLQCKGGSQKTTLKNST